MTPDEVGHELRRMTNQADEVFEQFTRARERIDTLVTTATAAGGQVEVAVRAGGELVDLRFGDRATRLHPAELAAQVLDAVRRAQAAIPGQVQDVLATEVPDGDPLADELVDELRAKFPAQPERQQEPVRDARPKYMRIGSLEDFS